MIIQTYDYVELRVDKGASKEKQLSDLTIGLTMIYLSIAKIFGERSTFNALDISAKAFAAKLKEGYLND